jgi:hypothetical protein
MVADPVARRPEKLLPIHPYFENASAANDITLHELREVYFGLGRGIGDKG